MSEADKSRSRRFFARNPEYRRNWLAAHPTYFKDYHSDNRKISGWRVGYTGLGVGEK